MIKKQNKISDLIKMYSEAWDVLDAYDKETLAAEGATKKPVKLVADDLAEAFETFKSFWTEKNNRSGEFAVERNKDGIEAIIGNVMQSLGKKEVYPTVEEKATHLFYFIVKNHPFVDGNKRGGAYAFVWLLHREGILDINRIPPSTLAALTLLIAESGSKEKDKIIRLILTLLKKF